MNLTVEAEAQTRAETLEAARRCNQAGDYAAAISLLMPLREAIRDDPPTIGLLGMCKLRSDGQAEGLAAASSVAGTRAG